MDAISRRIYLEEADSASLTFSPEHWTVQGPFMLHRLSQITFQIMIEPLPESGVDLYTRVNQVGDAQLIPKSKELSQLGREAIVCFVWYMNNLEAGHGREKRQ